MIYEDDEHIDVVRHHNRILRKANKALRNTHNKLQEQADENFKQVCETQTESDHAIEELWMRGELECSPQDYSTIVELAVEALQQQRRRISTQGFDGLENINY